MTTLAQKGGIQRMQISLHSSGTNLCIHYLRDKVQILHNLALSHHSSPICTPPSKMSSPLAKNKLFPPSDYAMASCMSPSHCESLLTIKIQIKCYTVITAADTILPIRRYLGGCVKPRCQTSTKRLEVNGWMTD